MSGVTVPQYPILELFGATAVNPDDITLPIPDAAPLLVGAASFDEGFPPATRTDTEAGGVAPYGQDFNGILYMLSAYCLLLQAGQIVEFDAGAATAFTGYAIGAKVASVTTPGRVWTNWLNGNTNDPDSVATGWASDDPLYATSSPAAGTYNDVAIPGASDYALDVDTTAGDVTHTGFIPQRNGQRLFLSNTGANLYNLSSLAGSAAAHQMRGIAGGITLLSGQTATIEYVAVLNKWLFV